MSRLLPPLLTLLFVADGLPPAVGQAGPPCPNDLIYMQNALGQPPCRVAASLQAQCDSSFPVTLASLSAGAFYLGPQSNASSQWSSNACLCSMPLFNLLQACQCCQGIGAVAWAAYTVNCTTAYTGTTTAPSLDYPMDVPIGTEIPLWANIDNRVTPWSQAQVFQNVSNSVPSTPVTDPSNSTTNASGGGGSSGNQTGKLAGGIIGGVIGLFLLVGGALHFLEVYTTTGERAGMRDPIRSETPAPPLSLPSRIWAATPGLSTTGRISPFWLLRGRTPGRGPTPASFASRPYPGGSPYGNDFNSSQSSVLPLANMRGVHRRTSSRGPLKGEPPLTPDLVPPRVLPTPGTGTPFEPHHSLGLATPAPPGLMVIPENARSSMILPEIQAEDGKVYSSYRR